MKLTATFEINSFEQGEAYDDADGVALARAQLDKTFIGAIAGNSRVEMLSARAGDAGAGYVALERLTVSLEGRSGSFVLLHAGTMKGKGGAGGKWAKWPIVPGSGTGELTGIEGEGSIDIDAQGQHHFTLHYTLS